MTESGKQWKEDLAVQERQVWAEKSEHMRIGIQGPRDLVLLSWKEQN